MGDWGSTSWSFYQCLDTANHSVHLLVTADLWGILQFGLQRVLYTPAAITVPFVLLRFLNWHEGCKTPIYLLNWHETNKRPYFLSHTHRHWTDNQICVVLSTLLYSVKNIFLGVCICSHFYCICVHPCYPGNSILPLEVQQMGHYSTGTCHSCGKSVKCIVG